MPGKLIYCLLCPHTKISKEGSGLDIRATFLHLRVVNSRNKLSREVVESPSLDDLKNRLNIFWVWPGLGILASVQGFELVKGWPTCSIHA